MTAIMINNVTDSILVSVSPEDTAISVSNGSVFSGLADGDYTPLYLISENGEYEIVHAVSVLGNTLDVIRAQEGTSAKFFPTGSEVQVRLTKQSLAEIDASEMTVKSPGEESGQSIETAIRSRVKSVRSISDISPIDAQNQAVITELAGDYFKSVDGWKQRGSEAVTVRVPTDFPDWQTAFDAYSTVKMVSDVRIDILLESGYVPQKGLYISGGDYSSMRIRSEDGIVQIASDFEGVLSKQNVPGNTIPRCVVVDSGTSPMIELRIDGSNYRVPDTSSDPRPYVLLGGLMVAYGASVRLGDGDGYGFFNFTGQGLYTRGARAYGAGCNFSGSGNHAAQLTGASVFYLPSLNGDDSWNNVEPYGPGVGNLTDAAISVSRGSHGSLQSSTTNRSGRTGIDVRRGTAFMGGVVSQDCARAELCIRNGGIAFAEVIDLGPTGRIELQTGGGFGFLGSAPIYGSIFTSSGRTINANELTNWGVIFDQGKTALGNTLIEEVNSSQSGYRVYSNGYCEMWQEFSINEDGTTDFDNLYIQINAPKQLRTSNPSGGNGSAAAFSPSGVSFRQGGTGVDNSLFAIQSRMISTYVSGAGTGGNGAWVIRHPFTGFTTPNVVSGVLWASGYVA